MLDQPSSASPSFGTSNGTAVWQSGWIDELWAQLTTGTFNGIGNVVVDGDVTQTEAQVLADLNAIDRMLLGSSDIDKLLSDVQSFATNNRFNPGFDSLTGSFPARNATQSLARVMEYVYAQGLPDLTATVGELSLDSVALPGDEGRLSITLKNQGGLKTQSPMKLKVFASLQPTLDSRAVEIGEMGFGSLKLEPGKSKTVSAVVKLPDNFGPGNYNIFVAVDTENAVPEANEANNVVAVAVPQTVAWQFGNIAGQNKQLQLTEPDGDIVRFQLKGDGYGEVIESQGVKQLVLYGTTDKSDLTIQADGDGNVIGNVFVNGNLKQFYGTKTDLQGNFTITGSLERIVLDDVSNTQITIGPNGDAKHKVEISFDQVNNLALTSQSALKSLSVNRWVSDSNLSSLVSTPALESLSIKGDFNADVIVAGTLKQAKVGGVASGVWKLGSTDKLDLDATAAGWSLSVAGELDKLDVKRDLLGTVTAGNLKRIFVRGNLANAKVLVGANLGADGRIGGGDDTYGSGELKEFIVHGNVLSSVVGAGLDPLDGSFSNGNEQLVAGGVIGKIEVKGQVSGDSLFAAAQFNSSIQVAQQTINPETDARFLTPSKVLADTAAPAVTLALQADTGSDTTDGITSVATIIGTVSDQSAVTRLSAGFGAIPAADYVDISSYLQNGRFTLDASALAAVLGQSLIDGDYTLNVIAEDSFGNVSQPISYSYKLDTTSPTLSLISPLADGDHSGYVHLIGSVNEAVTISTTLEGNEAASFVVNSAGEFDQLLRSLPLSIGAHQLAVTLTDIAGNVVQTAINFEVSESAFVSGPAGASGWAATTAERLILGESDSYVVQATLPVALGQNEGSRTLRFAVDAAFDTSDNSGASEDRFALYLVDPANPSQTLLDNGVPGTPLFSLSGKTAEFTPGLVRYDGQYVEIDLTSIKTLSEGLLVFQMLNADGDNGSVVQVTNLTNEVDIEGTAGVAFSPRSKLVAVGAELALDGLLVNDEVAAVISKVRFNAETGQYTAELRLRNTGETTIGRQAAVVFKNLDDGITLQTVSGLDANGDPYVNFRNAIRSGGLAAGALSDAVEISFSNPDQLRMVLEPVVLVGGANRAPVFNQIAPLKVLAGQRLELPLMATDPDGDRVTFSLQANGKLTAAKFDGAGKLTFAPTPNQIGTYEFTLVATDGAMKVSQQVTLNVVPDPVTTTRISGQVLDTNGNPLANLPIELGRLQTVTDANGYFILTVPDVSFPTEEMDIAVGLGDRAFDPFFTGTQFIDLRRTTFDGTTGTSISNPLRHPNLVSAFMNGSMVYGNDAKTATALRTNDGTGRLKVSAGDLLPLNNTDYFPDGPLPNSNRSLSDPATLFATGDVRANENVGLTSLHTVFVREHNRLATEILAANPELSGDEVYERSRKLIAAQIQQITYHEYLPLLVGEAAIPTYTGYDSAVDPAISHLFAAAAFRMGHTQSPSQFLLVGENGEASALSLRESTFNPRIINQYGVDAILRGLYAQPAEAIDTKVINELRNTLFGPPGAGGIDLAAVDIERGRDVGLPDYNQARVDFGLAPVTSFAEITSDLELQAALKQVYGNVDDIDAIVGGLAEDHRPGSMVGELFQRVIADQFVRLRDGDRFWYENAQFTETELGTIRGTTLANLIERNTGITDLPDYLFSTLINPTRPLAAGSAASGPVTEYAAIDGSNNNLENPTLGTPGTQMRVDYTQEYGDGIRTPAGQTRLNSREISNTLFAQSGSIPDPSGATGFMLTWSQFMGHDLSFSPAGEADTLKFYGTQYESATGEAFPYVAEKISLLLNREVYAGVNNVIERPIYLPALDLASNIQTTDAQGNITVSNDRLAAQVSVAANALTDRAGNPFTGQLTISQVPPELTPAALPKGLSPDLVVTIQPGEMAFSTPAELTLPNTEGWAPGMEMDLWSINPNSGEFEIVGKGQVSEDGQSIRTVEGGIRNSSWHFFANPPLDWLLGLFDAQCNECAANQQNTAGDEFSSDVEFYTGGLTETHSLTTYQSMGQTQGVQLVYDSLRADARPIFQVGFGEVNPSSLAPGFEDKLRLTADLKVYVDGVERQVPGYAGREAPSGEGKHFWKLPETAGPVNAGLQADLRDVDSGVYSFEMNAGIQLAVPRTVTTIVKAADGSSSSSVTTVQRFVGTTAKATQGSSRLVHVNTVNSAFGSGWGIAGVQELREGYDGSILLIDGDGSELLFDAPTAPGGNYVAPPGDFSILKRLADGTFRRTSKNQTVYTFDVDHRLVSVVDRNGNLTRHDYNEAGQLVKIIDPAGLETTFAYNARGKVSRIVDPANRVTELVYDNSGNLLQIKDPDASQRTFDYDAEHHMTGEVDQRGHQERAHYDEFGRATYAERKDGSTVTLQAVQTKSLYSPELTTDLFNAPYAFSEGGKTATFVDGNSNVTKAALDNAGQLIEAVDGGGSHSRVSRNNNNLITQIVDGRSFTTDYKYDELGNLLTVREQIEGGTVSSRPASSLSFDGIDDAINFGDTIGDFGQEDFTVEWWMNTTSEANGTLLGKREYCGPHRFWEVDISGGHIALEFFNTYSNSYGLASSKPVNDGKWHHIGISRDNNVTSIFIDGELDANYTHSSQLIFDNAASFIVGDLPCADSSDGRTEYQGKIDELRIWDYARSQQQIKLEKDLDLGGRQSGLLGYWKFDEGGGTVATDSSGNNINGYLINGAEWVTAGAPPSKGTLVTNQIFFDDFENGERSEWSRNTISTMSSAFSGRFGSESQTLTLNTNPGETYKLQFDFLAIDSWDGDGTNSSPSDPDSFRVSINNKIVLDEIFPYSDLRGDLQPRRTPDITGSLGFSGWNDSIYRNIALEFTAAEETTLISFSGHGLHDLYDESWGIDNVEVSQSFILTGNSQREYTYDKVFNQVSSIVDERGNLTLFDIDTTNGNRRAMTRVVGEVDSLANGETDDVTTTYTYTSYGLLDTLTDALGRVTDYDYDAVGRLSQARFAVGTAYEARQQFEYDAAGNLTAFVNENGSRTQYTYDTRNRLIQVTEADPDQAGPLTSPVTGFTYDAAGNVTATTDARGNQTQYRYDARDRLSELINANGDRTTYAYDATGNMTSATNALGHTTRYEYDSRNRRTAVIDPEGNKTRFRYDLDNNLTAVIDPLGNKTSYAYDARNRLVRETDALGNTTAYVYDATNNLVELTDRRGNETTYGYDALNRMTQVSDALGGVAAFGYDKVGNLLNRSDALGNVTAFAYDSRNRLTQRTDALGGTVGYTYDGVGNQLTVTDELNRTISYAYDALNRLTQRTDALNHGTRYGYDATGNLTGRTDALGRTTAYRYDALNRQVGMTDAAGGTSGYRYDAVSNLTAYTDELGRTTAFVYDQRNLQTQVIDPLGHATSTTYDAVGNVATVADALGNTTQYDYDALYRRTKVIDALGKETVMIYDEEDNLLSLTDASGNITNHAYDKLNRLSTESITVDGAELSRQYTYDAASNLVEKENRNGQVQSFTYDQLNRQTQEQWLDEQGSPIRAIDYTYDAASQLTAVRDPDSAYAYAYDAAGRLVSTDNAGSVGVPDVLLRYGYDAVNNRTSVTDEITGVQAGVETFNYDALNRVTRITQSGNGVADKRVDMTYDAASQMTGLARYSDLAGTQSVANTAYVHDAAGRLTDLTHGHNSGVIADYGFTYDAANRLTQLTTPDGTSDYSYNGRDELTGSDHSYQADEGYSYDDTGNRTNEGYSTGDHNRLLSDGTYTYEYDNEGNRTKRVVIASGETTEYDWDYRNRLISVVTKNSSGAISKFVEYTYDLYDRRIAKSVDSDGDGAAAATEERYVYDGEHIALVFDGGGNQLSRYLHGPQIDQVLAEETATGEVRWALSDQQGSVRDVIDSQGTVLNHLTYDSYGQVKSESSPELIFRFGYTGREWDEETGLYYYRARYFDPEPGTFVSTDPLGFGAGDSNIYRYVFNSPTNYTDPSGQIFWVPLIVGVVAAPIIVNFLMPPPPAQAPMHFGDAHEDEYFWQRICANIVVSAGLEGAAGSGFANGLPSIIDDWIRGVGNYLDDAARGLDDLIAGSGPRLVTAGGDAFGDGVRAGGDDGAGSILRSAGDDLGGSSNRITPEGVLSGMSKNNLKHAKKHLPEFQKLDPNITESSLRELGASIVKPQNQITQPGASQKAFEEVINVGGQPTKVRVVLNELDKLHSVHIRP